MNAVLLLPTGDKQHPDMKTAFVGTINRLEMLRKSGAFGESEYIDVYFRIIIRVLSYTESLSQA